MKSFQSLQPLVDCCLPITKSKYLIDNIGNTGHEQITLKVISSKSNKEIAVKLHQQFAHPSSEKLLKLVNKAGEL